MENSYKKKSIKYRLADKFQRRNRGNIFMLLTNYYFYFFSKIWNFTKDSRGYILAQIAKNSVIAEIGVWKGEFSNEIFKNVKPNKLILVDPWRYDKNIRGCSQVEGKEPLIRNILIKQKKIHTENLQE